MGTFGTIGLMAVGTGLEAIGGIVQAIDGGIQAKAAKEEADAARIEMERQKERFAQLDTSNPYLNLENTFEDLTVNQQAAEFTRQQSMQSQANIMQQMRGAAGASGIAALAQTLANQASTDAQKASVTIAEQERANQLKSAEEASRIQGLEREGELISRQAEFGKTQSLLGMSADELANAREQQNIAKQQQMQGIGTAVGAAADFVSFAAFQGLGKKGAAADGVVTPSQAPSNITDSTQLLSFLGGFGQTGAGATTTINGIAYQLQPDGSYKPIGK